MSDQLVVAREEGVFLVGEERFKQARITADVFLKSGMLPQHHNEASVLIGLDIALRTRQNPLAVLQSMYVVGGRPGWSAQYLIHRAAAAGQPIDWLVEGQGADLAVTAYFSKTPDRKVTVTMATARAEGWTKNAKYQTMPELMLRYRSATALVRLYLPEATLGLATVDELETMEVAPAPTPEAQAQPARGPAALRAQLEGDDDVGGDDDELSRVLEDLRKRMDAAQWREARELSGVRRLDQNSPRERYLALIDACRHVLASGTPVADAMDALEQLHPDDRAAVCAAARIGYDGESGMPVERLSEAEAVLVLREAQQRLPL